MSVSDFCSMNDGSCGNSSCETIETDFCDINKATKVVVGIAMILLFASGSYQAALVLESAGCIPCHRSNAGVASTAAAMQILAMLLCAVAVPLWAAAKGELPDLTTGGVWEYLPADQSTLSWSVSGTGIYLTLFLTVPFAIGTVVCSLIGAAASTAAPFDDIAAVDHVPLAMDSQEMRSDSYQSGATIGETEMQTADERYTNALL